MIELEQRPADLPARALEAFDAAFQGDGAPAPFAEARRKAMDSFQALGIPARKDEAWKYTNIGKALKHDYALDAAFRDVTAADVDARRIDGLDAITLVVANGTLRTDLSDELEGVRGLKVGSLRQAAREDGEAVARYFGRYADADADAFVALNTAFDLDGLFVHVAEGVALERPIHVVHLATPQQDALLQSRNLLVFEAGTIASVVETYAVEGDAKTFGNHVSEIVVGEGAVVEHVRVQDEGPEATQVATLQGYQAGRSVFATRTFTFTGATVRNNINLVPDGDACESHLTGLSTGREAMHVDFHTLVDHVHPGCESNELVKSVVADQATGVFNGKVFVRREAQQTNAYQTSQGVVLSDDARHFSKPELEIYADDVQCSHGSTTGELEPEHLFYLRSRGVSEVDARALLLYAFARDVVEGVTLKALRPHLEARVAERLEGIQ